MSEQPDRAPDFVDLVAHLTNFISNERIAAYNEAVDMMLANVRQWMLMHDIAPQKDGQLPEYLDQIAHHFKECGEEGAKQPLPNN